MQQFFEHCLKFNLCSNFADYALGRRIWISLARLLERIGVILEHFTSLLEQIWGILEHLAGLLEQIAGILEHHGNFTGFQGVDKFIRIN